MVVVSLVHDPSIEGQVNNWSRIISQTEIGSPGFISVIITLHKDPFQSYVSLLDRLGPGPSNIPNACLALVLGVEYEKVIFVI